MILRRNILAAAVAVVLSVPTIMVAQRPDTSRPDNLPRLDVENVTVVGTRAVVLPTARKGEVVDSSSYRLGDDAGLLFGTRISNLEGDGGQLPNPREFEDHFTGLVDASIGTYLSPRVDATAEWVGADVNGWVRGNYRATAGHVDSSEASGWDLRAGFEYLIPGELPTPGRARLSANGHLYTDDFTLFGSPVAITDRALGGGALRVGLHSETDAPYDYRVSIGLERTAVEDFMPDGSTSSEFSAVTPEFDLALELGGDELRGRGELLYRSTSLDYPTPTLSPRFFRFSGEGTWHVSDDFHLQGGALYGFGEHSDSGESSLLRPFLAGILEVSPTLAVRGGYQPRIEAFDWGYRMREVPYVDPSMPVRPVIYDHVVTAGIALGFNSLQLDGTIEWGAVENYPVVLVGGDAGSFTGLTYGAVSATMLKLRVDAGYVVNDRILVEGAVELLDLHEDETDTPLSLVPDVRAELRADYAFSDPLRFWGRISWSGERPVMLESFASGSDVPALLDGFLNLGLGGEFRLFEGMAVYVAVSNALNVDYQLFPTYQAPGLEGRIGARLGL